ncbi:hypothetical protein I551_3134 [Mycobacterium ulcerans str. Harvey]|uniref:Uncharacterized protein n=1 Tax=Mycobacterium ulcerans str. Harvey TaxID=1299332 RepID=A0ABN0R0G2_MYCUL|nr:hypothetical protein I551_3134 [Mycobacterium ulcerans str. Harvey]
MVAGHVGLADRAPGFPFTAVYLGVVGIQQLPSPTTATE